MNIHKHARLTYARRLEMVEQMIELGWSAADAAAEHGVTPVTARKWLGRYLAGGQAALADASSRPAHSPRAIDPSKALLIVELRRRRITQARIARSVGVSDSTVSRVLARAGLSKLSDLEPAEPVVRYEHDQPGELLHIDTKKLGRIERPSHPRASEAVSARRHSRYLLSGGTGAGASLHRARPPNGAHNLSPDDAVRAARRALDRLGLLSYPGAVARRCRRGRPAGRSWSPRHSQGGRRRPARATR